MKSKLILFSLLLVMIITSGCIDEQLSTLGLGTPIPVTFDNQDNPDGYPGKYWIGTAQITGTDTQYTLTMPEGITARDKTVNKEIVIQISGISTEWSAAIEEDPSPMRYNYVELFGPEFVGFETLKTGEVPYYNLGTNHRLTAKAQVKIILPDGTSQVKTISSYGKDTVITFPVRDSNGIMRTIYFKVQSVQLTSGDLPPSGDLSVVKTPLLSYTLVKSDDLQSGIWSWNSFVWNEYYNTLQWTHFDKDSWNDAFNWMSGNGMLPDRKPEVAKSITITTGTDAKVIISYPTTVFAPLVTFYIPDEIAETITVNEQTPEFTFDKISKISGVEGGSHRLKVSGVAKSTGTIRLSVDGPAINSGTWVGGPENEIKAGQREEFYVDLEFNTALIADTTYTCTVYSMPAGFGTPTWKEFDVYLTDKDSAESYAVRVYAINDQTGDKVMSAPLYVGYGSDRMIGVGDSTTIKPEGSYQIYSENVTGWYAAYTADHPKTVIVDEDKSIEILFTTEPPKQGGVVSLWLPGIVILLILGGIYMYTGGPGSEQVRTISKPVIKIMSRPGFWIFVSALILALVAWFIYQDFTGKVDDLTRSIENFEVF